jgi:hypothetical protein
MSLPNLKKLTLVYRLDLDGEWGCGVHKMYRPDIFHDILKILPSLRKEVELAVVLQNKLKGSRAGSTETACTASTAAVSRDNAAFWSRHRL